MSSVFLAIPTYNDSVHTGTLMGVVTATQDHALKIGIRGSSLLAHGFNHLWVSGIKSGCDYFAMCHSDVGPSAGWLDVLIGELESHNADLLSAVVPVKTSEKVYSTAICEIGSIPSYRLTQEHLDKLPDTFGTTEMREITGQRGWLCCNTGLWVCRLGQEWNRQVSFEVRSWIDWDNDQPMVMPEDWDFSLQLCQLGLKVMATKRVPLIHSGTSVWRTSNATSSSTPVSAV